MKDIKQKIVLAGAASLLAFNGALAGSPLDEGKGAARPDGVPDTFLGDGGIFQTISNVLIFLTAAIAVIMLIVGGLRYVISSGDASRVKAAKDTILYGVLGLVLAILAYGIVNFVVNALTD